MKESKWARGKGFIYLDFAVPRRPNTDELSLLAGYDYEAKIRKAISVVLEIDKLMNLNIENPAVILRTGTGHIKPTSRAIYHYCGIVCASIIQEMVGPTEHSLDHFLKLLHVGWVLVYLRFKGHKCAASRRRW